MLCTQYRCIIDPVNESESRAVKPETKTSKVKQLSLDTAALRESTAVRPLAAAAEVGAEGWTTHP